MMSLQFVLLDDPLWPLLIVIAILALLVGSYLKFLSIRRNQQIDVIDQIMVSKPSVSITELVNLLDTKRMDRKTLYGLIRRSEMAILSFSKTSVVSTVFLDSRLKNNLVNNSVIHVDKEAMRWDVTPPTIESMIETISDREALDVLQTKDGDYLLVPDLKDRIRESLELQGRADVVAEAQRLRVDLDDLVSLIKTWGWYVWQSSSGFMYSVKWLLGTLERSIAKTGFLDLEKEAGRLDLTPSDILTVIRLYNWDFIEAKDNRVIPLHLLQDDLLQRLEALGSLNLKEESGRLGISIDALERTMKKLGLTLVSTNDDSVMTLEQIRHEIADDAELAGIITPAETAERLGIETELANRILGNHSGIRRIKGGRFLSYRSLRNYILDEVRKDGIVYTGEIETKWALNRIELAAILKRFGLKTVLTKSGNYLSISWMRRWLSEALQSGEVIEPNRIAERFDTESGMIESILATIRTDTLMDGDGKFISREALFKELDLQFQEMGILKPNELAIERGLDISDIMKTIQPLENKSFLSENDDLVSKDWLIAQLKSKLQNEGMVDLNRFSEDMQLEYEEVRDELDTHLGVGETLLSQCRAVVSSKWIKLLRVHADEAESINLKSFAGSRSISENVALCLLRAILQGVYLPSSGTYFVKS